MSGYEMQAMDGEDSRPKKKMKVKPGSFQGLGLNPTTLKAVKRLGYNMPTPIQRKTIPIILEGQDVVAMARTGSGKTAAFLIPVCERLKSHSVAVGCRSVVLSPTRELAMQTGKVFRQMASGSGLRCCLLVGGQAMEAQFEHLANNPDVLVATPGRLMHHLVEAELSLSRVEVLVFDEADRLFELGFAEQLGKILAAAPLSRQCLLFSATLPAQLVAFSRSGIKNPVFVRLDVETTLSDQLKLWYLYVRKDEKLAAAVSVLRRLHQDGKMTIMFVATKHHVEFFGELLDRLGLPTAVVYGSMDQVAREEQVARFRKRKALIMVTTDVAARGIDIPLLDHVLNFDFPPSAKLFVHRSGRTARAGRAGLSVSLVTLEDLPYAVELMLFLGHKLSAASIGDEGAEGEGSERSSDADNKRPLIGALPGMEDEVETLNALLQEEDSLLMSLHKSMMASYHIYNKTRPSASKQSVARAKQLLADCGGPAQLQGLIHPAFRDRADAGVSAVAAPLAVPATKERPQGFTSSQALIQELRGFRPKAQKVGNVLTEASTKLMEQHKLDAVAVANARGRSSGAHCGSEPMDTAPAEAEGESASAPKSKRRHRAGLVSPVPAPVVPRPGTEDRPRISKAARRKQAREGGIAGGGAAEFAGFDVSINGTALGSGASAPSVSKKEPAEQFYLSVAKDRTQEAKETGLAMEEYQMDLLPDERGDIQRQKSVMRWDAKKKKYLPVMVSADGRVVKKNQTKNESGVKVTGDREKSSIYKKWAEATKRRIQKVGELELGASDPLGNLKSSAGQAKTVDFGGGDTEDGDWGGGGGNEEGSGRKRKPVVPFHGQIEDKYLTNKQKRQLKKREQKDRVVGGESKDELKTATQMVQAKKKREMNKLKQKPHLRQAKAQQAKQAREKMHHERQMAGARTRSKMLIFEGPKKKKYKGGDKLARFGNI